MTHEEKVARWIGLGKIGVEIGAFQTPVPGLSPAPFYVDCYKEFGFQPVRADYYGHACALPFRTNSLDYVVASHVLEHVANPVLALAEWYRVLRPGGIMYFVVPDRRFTWDETRPLTSVAHLLEDFDRGTLPTDATHIDDFAFGVDWSRFNPATPAGEIPAERASLAHGLHRVAARGEPPNIHFHTFEPASVRGLCAELARVRPADFNWRIIDSAERFPRDRPDGILTVLRVRKRWRDRFAGAAHRFRTIGNRQHVVRVDAQPFAEFARTCAGLGGPR